MNILGVTLAEDLCMDNHITNIIMKCNKLLYALKIVRNRGLDKTSMHDVFYMIVISNILYAVNKWSGLCTNENYGQLEKVVKRGIQMGIWPKEEKCLRQLIEVRAKNLFTNILKNKNHVLHYLLPDIRDCKYNLCKCTYNRKLPEMKAPHDNRNFLIRMMYE